MAQQDVPTTGSWQDDHTSRLILEHAQMEEEFANNLKHDPLWVKLAL